MRSLPICFALSGGGIWFHRALVCFALVSVCFFFFCVTYDSQHRYSPGRLALSAPYRVTPLCRLSRLCQNYEQIFILFCFE